MSSPGFTKRQKERARQDKQREKELRKQARRNEKDAKGPTEPGVDPDIAGIIPGPQPVEADLEE